MRRACLALIVTISSASAAWSVDGMMLATTRTSDSLDAVWGPGRVALVDCASGSGTILDSGTDCFGPCFSPDGRQVAYSKGGQVWIMNNDGSGKTAICTCASSSNDPAMSWTTDGHLYWSESGPRVLRANISTGAKEIVHTTGGSQDLDWVKVSRDGTRGACTAGGAIRFFVGDPSSEVSLGPSCMGSISPDGSRVACNWWTDPGGHVDFKVFLFDDPSSPWKSIPHPYGDGNSHRFSHSSNRHVVFTGTDWSPSGYRGAYVCDIESETVYYIGFRGTPWDFWPGTLPPPPAYDVTIDSFTADPATIQAGQSSTLSWATTNATSVTLDGNAVSEDGSVQVTPSATTAYTLTAEGAGGPVQRQVTVTVVVDQAPHGGTPHAVPGRIEAEDYDIGGEGVAYHDTTPGNTAGEYRADDVDIEVCTDSGGGYSVGWASAGEWLEFTVNVAGAGDYDVAVRVASDTDGGPVHVEVDGVDVTGQIAVGNTGGWDAWTTRSVSGVSLSSGGHVVRLVWDGASSNVNWLDVKSSSQNTPPSAAGDAATTDEGVPVTIDVLANDVDPDGDQLVVAALTQPADGEASVIAGGMVEYVPASGFAGTDEFTYTVTDGRGGTATATVSVLVIEAASESITITSPAGGEVWYVGTEHHIRWSTEGVDDVNVLYSTGGGQEGTFLLIAGSIALGDQEWGSLAWTVPDAPSSNVVVTVVGYFGDCPTESGVFEIRAVSDTDADGMDDAWEIATFGDLSHDETTDADGDGLTDYVEFTNGTDPLSPDSAPGSAGFGCLPVGQTGAPGASGPSGYAVAALLFGAAVLLARDRGLPRARCGRRKPADRLAGTGWTSGDSVYARNVKTKAQVGMIPASYRLRRAGEAGGGGRIRTAV